MNFRIATLDDLANIAHLHAISWQENYHSVLAASYLNEMVFKERLQLWAERLNNPLENQWVFVAEEEKGEKTLFCGFICVYGDHHERYGTIIDNLHVSASYKGKGLGTQLMVAAAQWAYQYYPKTSLYLEVLECNHKARGFYEALGAKNEAVGYWQTPCGNKVKEFIYIWPTAQKLIPLS